MTLIREATMMRRPCTLEIVLRRRKTLKDLSTLRLAPLPDMNMPM